MPTFYTNDDEKFVAENAKELVKQMAKESFDGNDTTLHQYMQEVAERSQRAAGVNLRFDNCDNFVSDMLIHGLLKSEP